MNTQDLRKIAYESLVELATEDGITASGRGEAYGCIFGRDSAVTILKMIKVTRHTSLLTAFEKQNLLAISRRGLLKLVSLQGKETNIESGEQPGKFIHEYRPDNYERLLTLNAKPWYIYPDGILRNFDSLDSTPLCLIAMYRYWEATKDSEFLLSVLPAVEAGLNWIITYGDMDKDFLLEYELPEARLHGGLVVQSWTDSHESVRQRNGKMPEYPIAPVEVQGYAWLALKLWADFYADESLSGNTKPFAKKLQQQAASLKEQFNKTFLFTDPQTHDIYAAQALDGVKNQLKTVTGNPLLLLWATYQPKVTSDKLQVTSHDGGLRTQDLGLPHKGDPSDITSRECILDDAVVAPLVRRAFKPDMFDADGGIRTMSTLSPTYNAGKGSYHNGSFWPKLNGMSHEGLVNWEFKEEANLLRNASIKAISYFGSPIELYTRDADGKYQEFQDVTGQVGCRQQAWSAAAALDFVAE